MTEDKRIEAMAAPAAVTDTDARLAALRAAGAHRADAVRLHHVEALARRASAHEGSARRVLDARLSEAIATLEARFEQSKRDAGDLADRAMLQFPHAAHDLRQLLSSGDFRGLRKMICALEAGDCGETLAALVRALETHGAAEDGALAPAAPDSRPELKALRRFRSTWSRLSVERQVSQALEQAPKNPGPINSHMLVLRSLALMRDISPAYLDRFMSYAETLLSLDQDEAEKPAKPKKRPAAKTRK